MSLRFVKMSGAGNDFVVIDAEVARELGETLRGWTRAVCRRRLSVGSDGLLVIERLGEVLVGVRFLNPDGSEAFCGNGSRCAARYAADEFGFDEGAGFVLRTCAGDLPATVEGCRVRLGLEGPVDRGPATIRFEDVDHIARRVDSGTPHLVVRVDDIEAVPLDRFGPRFRSDPRFGEAGVNVNLWQFDGARIRLRTWEKGVEGETLSCGSGAVAAALAARLEAGGDEYSVIPRSGSPIGVRFESSGGVQFEGDARRIFEGELTDVEPVD